MLQRCYSKKSSNLEECHVSEDWKTFSNFLKWCKDKGYSKEDMETHHLDKDLLTGGIGGLYSEETCTLLHPKANTFLSSFKKTCNNGKGISYHKNRSVFVSQVRNPMTGKKEYLGCFKNAKDAEGLWLTRKEEIAKELLSLGYFKPEHEIPLQELFNRARGV